MIQALLNIMVQVNFSIPRFYSEEVPWKKVLMARLLKT